MASEAATAPAPAQPLFYKNVVPLSQEQHGDLMIEAKNDYSFAKETNCVYIAAIEFVRSAKEYPIVFGTAGDDIFPVALLGLKTNQNLFLDKDGKWDTRYIPAYVRRYPFLLATQDQKQFTVCIDESYTGFNKKKGERLFTKEGEQGELLERSVAFLTDYQAHVKRTEDFCKHLQKLDLLEPMQANIEKNGEKFALTGFLVVNREKLKGLKQGQVLALFNNDELELVYAHLSSLENMAAFVDRIE